MEVVKWAQTQKWCDSSKLVTAGVSYDGIAAEHLTANSPYKLQGSALLFSPFDLYTEVNHSTKVNDEIQ